MTLYEDLKWRGLIKDTAGEDLEKIINSCLSKQKNIINPTYEDYKKTDLATRLMVKSMIMKGEY